jgi:hypothetical protein
MNTAEMPHANPLRALDQRLVELRRETEELMSSLDAARVDVESALRLELEHRPYTVLGLAAALGYVAAGGLPSRLTALLLAIGGRVGIEYASRQLLARLSPPSAKLPNQNEVIR